MPYGKLCEGNRVFTAANGLADPADINEVQDQEKAMLGPRIIRGFPAQMFGGDNWTAGWYQDIIANGCSICNAAGAEMILHFPLRNGEKVTAATAVVSGTQNGGSIVLAYAKIGAAASTQDITAGAANPYATGVDNFANAVTYTYSATTYIIGGITADYIVMRFLGPGGTGIASLWDAYLTAQFGN